MQRKILIASDIHGSAFWCEKLLNAFEKENATRLILLGDLLYHGPRNDFPKDYAPKRVFSMLNGVKDKITAVRGNCDSEVDQMVLEFPCLADYALIDDDGKTLFLTHGHLYNAENPPLLQEGDILFNGHFHAPCHQTLPSGGIYANCGSTALPKEGTPHSYLLYENGKLTWKSLETDEIFDTLTL
ncbi:MAG: phosphodiesterase [Clostridia bacterium]|nr:phosphodiesterase [Clostridia bacterium]